MLIEREIEQHKEGRKKSAKIKKNEQARVGLYKEKNGMEMKAI